MLHRLDLVEYHRDELKTQHQTDKNNAASRLWAAVSSTPFSAAQDSPAALLYVSPLLASIPFLAQGGQHTAGTAQQAGTAGGQAGRLLLSTVDPFVTLVVGC